MPLSKRIQAVDHVPFLGIENSSRHNYRITPIRFSQGHSSHRELQNYPSDRLSLKAKLLDCTSLIKEDYFLAFHLLNLQELPLYGSDLQLGLNPNKFGLLQVFGSKEKSEGGSSLRDRGENNWELESANWEREREWRECDSRRVRSMSRFHGRRFHWRWVLYHSFPSIISSGLFLAFPSVA